MKEIQNDLELIITRLLDAPRELVFKVFSEAEHLAHWWGPKGMKIDVTKLDFRPGGTFHYTMTAENGYTMWGIFNYRDIIYPEKIEFVNSFSDPEGNITKPPFPDPWPLEIYNIISFTEKNNQTTLLLRARPINASTEERQTFLNGFESMEQGFGGTFDQLSEYLMTHLKSTE